MQRPKWLCPACQVLSLLAAAQASIRHALFRPRQFTQNEVFWQTPLEVRPTTARKSGGGLNLRGKRRRFRRDLLKAAKLTHPLFLQVMQTRFCSHREYSLCCISPHVKRSFAVPPRVPSRGGIWGGQRCHRTMTVPAARTLSATSGLTWPLRSNRPSASTLASDPLNST